MNGLKLKIIGILLGGILFLPAGNGQAFVTPQHYERMKMQNREKARGAENFQTQAPVEIQIHQPNSGQPQAGKPGPKQSPRR
jgi:hypothetical protein